MTKKDYILIATALKNVLPKTLITNRTVVNISKHQQWWKTITEIVEQLKLDNKSFNEKKFFNYMDMFINDNDIYKVNWRK